jgi:anti-sigma factor RsiW
MMNRACRQTVCYPYARLCPIAQTPVPELVYEVGLGFIYRLVSVCCSLRAQDQDGAHLSLATGHGDVHETASVCDSLLCAALGGLLLLLGLNLIAHVY